MEARRAVSAESDTLVTDALRPARDSEIEDMLDLWMSVTGANAAVVFERPHFDEPPLFRAIGKFDDNVRQRLDRAFRNDQLVRPGGGLIRLRRPYACEPDLLVFALEQETDQPALACALAFDEDIEEQIDLIEFRHASVKPTLQAFFRLWRCFQNQSRRQQALQAALNVTDFGILLLGPHCEIVFANAGAETLLAARDGIARAHGALRPAHRADGINLHAALGYAEERQACHADQNNGATRLLSFRRTEAPPLLAALHALPFPNGGDGAAILHIVDPCIDADRSVAPLCRLLGLSRVETTLVCRLSEGTSLAEAALLMGIREQTARSYLKQIFVKTGTKRQSELIARMLGSLIRVRKPSRHNNNVENV